MNKSDLIGKQFICMNPNEDKLVPHRDTGIFHIKKLCKDKRYLQIVGKRGMLSNLFTIENLSDLISSNVWCLCLNEKQIDWLLSLLYDDNIHLSDDEVRLIHEIIYERKFLHYTFAEREILNELRERKILNNLSERHKRAGAYYNADVRLLDNKPIKSITVKMTL